MKIVAYALVTLFALAGAAFAEPVKLTVNQAFSVSIGIEQLNKGATQIIKDGAKETQAQVTCPPPRPMRFSRPTLLSSACSCSPSRR